MMENDRPQQSILNLLDEKALFDYLLKFQCFFLIFILFLFLFISFYFVFLFPCFKMFLFCSSAVRHLLFLLAFGVFCAGQSSDGGQKADSEAAKRLEMARKGLNVHMFSSSNFAPMFGIIAGLSVVLIVAIAFIVVGLLSMEPAKDSIIYRMTTTRLKKD